MWNKNRQFAFALYGERGWGTSTTKKYQTTTFISDECRKAKKKNKQQEKNVAEIKAELKVKPAKQYKNIRTLASPWRFQFT